MPTVAPIQDKELEAERIDLDGRLKAYAQIAVVHLVELSTGVQQTNVACDGKEKIIIEGWQFRQLVFQHLRSALGALALLLDPRLRRLGKDFVRELPKPVLEERADDVGIIEIVIRNQIDVSVCSQSAHIVH